MMNGFPIYRALGRVQVDTVRTVQYSILAPRPFHLTCPQPVGGRRPTEILHDWTHGGGVNFVISGPAPFLGGLASKATDCRGPGRLSIRPTVNGLSLPKINLAWTSRNHDPDALEIN